jgi:hypothetical protein
MEPRRFTPRLLEVAVVLAGVLVAIYAGWVIRNGGANATPPDSSQTLGTRSSQSQSPSPSAEPVKAPTRPPSLASFRRAVDRADQILVVGGSTGNDLGEWVDLWAQDQAKNHAVTLHQWNATTSKFGEFPPIYGNGSGLDIWNLSYPGLKADYAQKLKALPSKPSAVIISVGHDRDKAGVRKAIRTTSKAIRQRWGRVPTAFILQNPSTSDAAKQQETAAAYVKTLATKDRVPVIDVHAAFVESGDAGSLLSDGAQPNNAGSRLWADTLEQALRQ